MSDKQRAVKRAKPAEPARDSAVTGAVTAIARWCVQHAAVTITLFLAVAVLSVALAAAKLKINTDPSLMINPDLPFRKNYQDFARQFPTLDNTFLIFVDSEDPERGRKAAGEIADDLKRRPDLFSRVFAPGSGAYFDKYGVLYLDEPVVKKLAEDVTQMAQLIDIISQQPDLAGLADLFQKIAPVAKIGRAPDDLSGFLDKIDDSVKAENQGKPTPLDWTSLGDEKPVINETRWYIFANPVLNYSTVDAAAGPIGEVRRLIKQTNGNDSGVKVQLTGEAALNAEEFENVSKGAAIAGVLSFTLVTLTVFIGLPSLVLLLPALSLIILGFLINAGFATLSVGYLNMISVAFAVLFIGLGIDYAVHVVLRFAEERAKGQDGKQAAIEAVRKTGAPLALCTLTTSLAFLAFVPTDFVGMAQLGIIAAGGVVIAFIASITLVPVILSLLPGPQEKIARKFSKLVSVHGESASRGSSSVLKFASLILILLALGSVWLLPKARFDGDPINLKDPAAPSMIAFNDLVKKEPGHAYAVQVLSEPGKSMREMIAKLRALPEVADVETVETVMPRNQQAKLADLNAIADVLPPRIEPAVAMSNEDRLGSLNAMLISVREIASAEKAADGLRASAAKLQKSLETFISAKGQSAESVKSLEASLLQGFPKLFDEVRQLSALDAVTLENLDQRLKDRYISPDGRWRLEVIPRGNMRDEAARARFINAVTAVSPNATGAPIEISSAAKVVASAMKLACLTALGLVIIVLFSILRRFSDVMLVLAPLMLAGALMVGYTVVFDAPFNFANVIVLPLLLGLGVHSAIHYVMRAREENVATDVTGTSTPRAVLIAAVTTIGSFGTLWLSGHRGMASMGELLTIAIIITLMCTLIVLPQLIRWVMKPPDVSKISS
jgi:hopanoid biosynthesis associated RND transporter like protein HpnN